MTVTDEDRVRQLLRDVDTGPAPTPDLQRIVRLGERRARWRRVDRYLAAAAVAVVVVGAALFAVRALGPRGAAPVEPAPKAFALEIRPVLAEAATTPAACPKPLQRPATATDVRACSTDGTLVYTLGAAAVTGDDVGSLATQPSTSSAGYDVVLALTPSGARAFETLTGRLATQPSPTNQFAIYAQGLVQTSPYVAEAITSGTAEVVGFPSQADAQRFITQVAP